MEMTEHQNALKEVLNKVIAEYGEPAIGKFIAETIASMNWNYNTANDTLTDIAREAMMKIDTTSVSPEVYQLEGYVNRLMTRIKNSK